MPGVGLDGVERIDDFFEHVDLADLIIFPDVGDGSLQEYLRHQGKLVFGTGIADQIETDKIGFNLWLASSSLPSPDMWLIEGLDSLEAFLKDPQNDDIWLKSNDRGDLETHHHKNWNLSQIWFHQLNHDLGPNRELIKIIAQKPLEAQDEIGYDGYCIDGQFPEYGIYGFEAKDAMYVGKFTSSFPRSLGVVNDVVGNRVANLGYRGPFSTEVRETPDGSFYFIDPTHRFGSPPSECMLKWYNNWDEIAYFGAQGQLIEPELVDPSYLWGAEVILKSGIKESFLPIYFPESTRKLLSLHYHCKIGGVDYIKPKDIEEFGAACGFGRTPAEACEAAMNIAKLVECEEFRIDESAMDKLLETVSNYEVVE